jgi:hypothetical protein
MPSKDMQNINGEKSKQPNKLLYISLALSILFLVTIWTASDNTLFSLLYLFTLLPTTWIFYDFAVSIQTQLLPNLWDSPSFSHVELVYGFYSLFALISLFVFIRWNKEHIKRRTAFALCFLLIFCCANFWVVYERAIPQSPLWKPTAQDITGTYYPINGLFNDSSNIWEVLKDRETSSKYPIIFYADGRFSAINIPVWNREQTRYDYGKTEGFWKLEKNTHSGQWNINLHITNLDSIEVDSRLGISILEKSPPFILHFQIGELEWLMYEKQ